MKKLAKVTDFGKIIYSFDDFRAKRSDNLVTKYGYSPAKFERFELDFKDNTVTITASDGFYLAKGTFNAETFEEKTFDIYTNEKLTKKLCFNELSDDIYFEENEDKNASSIGKLIVGNKSFMSYDTERSFNRLPIKKDFGSFTLKNIFDSLVEVFDEEKFKALKTTGYKRRIKPKYEENTFEHNTFYVNVTKDGLLIKDLLDNKVLHFPVIDISDIDDERSFHINKWMLYRMLKLFKECSIEEITFFLAKRTILDVTTADVFIEGGNLFGAIAGIASKLK